MILLVLISTLVTAGLLLLAKQNIIVYKPNLLGFSVFLVSVMLQIFLVMVDWLVTRFHMIVASIRHTRFRAFTALSRLDKINRQYFDVNLNR